jgi:hypothetical protein
MSKVTQKQIDDLYNELRVNGDCSYTEFNEEILKRLGLTQLLIDGADSWDSISFIRGINGRSVRVFSDPNNGGCIEGFFYKFEE